jgi:hypothetical protein
VDWARARAYLLTAFLVVNLILAYSIWGPTAMLPYLSEEPQDQTYEEFRETLANRKLVVPVTLSLPRTPAPMRFLRVESPPTPDFLQWAFEINAITRRNDAHDDMALVESLRPTIDPQTKAVSYFPRATGTAAHEMKLDNREHVIRVAEEYLRLMALLPADARVASVTENRNTGTVTVEFCPLFDGIPVFSGYVRVEMSPRGVEKVSRFWVEPREYAESAPKQVRPAREALLRLAGRLASARVRTVTEIQLGYYAGRTLSLAQSDDVHGWDTVPVWRITLDGGETYYINALNGEWES